MLLSKEEYIQWLRQAGHNTDKLDIDSSYNTYVENESKPKVTQPVPVIPAPEPTQDTPLATFGKTASKGIVPTLAGAAGWAGASVFAPESFGLSYIIPAAASVASSVLASKGQEAVLKASQGEEQYNKTLAELQKSQQANPKSAFAGELAPMLLTGKPDLTGKSYLTAGKGVLQGLQGGALQTAEKEAIKHTLKGAAIGAGTDIGTQLVTEPENFNVGSVAKSAGLGALFNKPALLGRSKIFGGPGLAEDSATAIDPQKQPNSDSTTTEALLKRANEQTAKQQEATLAEAEAKAAATTTVKPAEPTLVQQELGVTKPIVKVSNVIPAPKTQLSEADLADLKKSFPAGGEVDSNTPFQKQSSISEDLTKRLVDENGQLKENLADKIDKESLQLAAKAGVKSVIVDPNFTGALGRYDRNTRTITLSPQTAVDTLFHEGSHATFHAAEAGETSPLQQKILASAGAEEPIVAQAGQRGVKLLLDKSQGKVGGRILDNIQDVISATKARLGITLKPEEAANLLARWHIINGQVTAKGEAPKQDIVTFIGNVLKEREGEKLQDSSELPSKETKSITPEQNEIIKNYADATQNALNRTTYGSRNFTPKRSGYLAYWSNANNRWDIGNKYKIGETISVDANVIPVPASNKNHAQLIADNLPELPLAINAQERNPIFRSNKLTPERVEEIHNFYKKFGEKIKVQDSIPYIDKFMDTIRSPEQRVKYQDSSELPLRQGLTQENITAKPKRTKLDKEIAERERRAIADKEEAKQLAYVHKAVGEAIDKLPTNSIKAEDDGRIINPKLILEVGLNHLRNKTFDSTNYFDVQELVDNNSVNPEAKKIAKGILDALDAANFAKEGENAEISERATKKITKANPVEAVKLEKPGKISVEDKVTKSPIDKTPAAEILPVKQQTPPPIERPVLTDTGKNFAEGEKIYNEVHKRYAELAKQSGGYGEAFLNVGAELEQIKNLYFSGRSPESYLRFKGVKPSEVKVGDVKQEAPSVKQEPKGRIIDEQFLEGKKAYDENQALLKESIKDPTKNVDDINKYFKINEDLKNKYFNGHTPEGYLHRVSSGMKLQEESELPSRNIEGSTRNLITKDKESGKVYGEGLDKIKSFYRTNDRYPNYKELTEDLKLSHNDIANYYEDSKDFSNLQRNAKDWREELIKKSAEAPDEEIKSPNSAYIQDIKDYIAHDLRESLYGRRDFKKIIVKDRPGEDLKDKGGSHVEENVSGYFQRGQGFEPSKIVSRPDSEDVAAHEIIHANISRIFDGSSNMMVLGSDLANHFRDKLDKTIENPVTLHDVLYDATVSLASKAKSYALRHYKNLNIFKHSEDPFIRAIALLDMADEFSAQIINEPRNSPFSQDARIVIKELFGEKFLNALEDARTDYKYSPVWDAEKGMYYQDKSELPGRTKQTDTPEFKKWFGDSKVVDKEGKPLIMYHGTGADFSTFKGRGVTHGWFSSSNSTASAYADQAGGNVKPVFLHIKNPAPIEMYGKFVDTQLKRMGYDGVLFKSEDGKHAFGYTFSPEQIKSATGNRGTFDSTNPDIRYQPSSNLPSRIKNALLPAYERITSELEGTPQAEEGRVATRGLNKQASLKTYYEGKYENGVREILRPYTELEKSHVLHKQDVQDITNGRIIEPLTTREAELDRQIREDWYVPIHDDQRAKGILIDGREARDNPNKIPSIISQRVKQALTEKGFSADAQRYKDIWIKYRMMKGGESLEDATKVVDDYIRAINAKAETSVEFAAIRRASGLGLPMELRDNNLTSRLTRYAKRVAQDFSWHDAIQADPRVQKVLFQRDAEGKLPEHDVVLESGKLAKDLYNYKFVKDAVELAKGHFNPQVDPVMKVAKLVTSAMLGTGTGLRNNLSLGSQILPYVTVRDLPSITKTFSDVITNFKQANEKSFLAGAHKERINDTQFADNPDNIISGLDKASDFIRKYQGADLLERLGRVFGYSLGENLTRAHFNRLNNNSKDVESLRFIKKFSNIVDGVDAYIGKPLHEIPQEIVSRISKEFVDSVQGSYDGRELPMAVLNSPYAPFMSLSRWSIGRMNRINSDVVKPLVQDKNPIPLIKYTLGTILTGVAIQNLNDLLNNKRGTSPTVKESLASENKEEVAYSTIALMQLGSFAGIVGDLLKAGVDVRHGQMPQGPFSFPLQEFVGTTAQDIANFSKALNEGADVTKTSLDFVEKTLRNTIQGYRYISNNFIKNDDITRKEKFRDYETFKLLSGEPTSSFGFKSNEFLDKDIKQFKRESDPSKIAAELRPIIDRIVRENKNNPEKMKRALESLKQNSYQTMPNLENNPETFKRYMDFLDKTVGKTERLKRTKDYFRQKELNRLKSDLVPSL